MPPSTAAALRPLPLPPPVSTVRIRRLTDHLAALRPRLVLVDCAAERAAPPSAPPSPPSGRELHHWLAAVLEALDGRRPLAQLAEVLPAADRAALLGWARASGPGPRTLRSIHPHRTTAGAIDVCARIEHAHRSRAMTGRIELRRGRWRFTQLALV